MNTGEPFDPLVRFAEIEWLVAKIYYRLSHLFLDRTELRDFWWDMAKEEEQHASILIACKSLIDNYEDEKLDPEITRAKADELKQKLLSHLNRGTAALSVDESFRIALQIESPRSMPFTASYCSLAGRKSPKPWKISVSPPVACRSLTI